MALKNLSTAAMISLTKPWVTEGNGEREILLKFEETGGLLKRVESVQEELLAMQPRTNERLLSVSEKQGALDLRHDDLVRGIHGFLTSLGFLVEDPRERQALTALRDELLPHGITLIQRSYRDEAGEAALLRARLSASTKKALKAIPLPKGTLADAVNRYLDVGDELGLLEDEKVALGNRNGSPTGASVVAARHRWVRNLNAMMALLDIVPIEDEERTLVLQRFERASRAAERGGADGPESEVETETTPAPVGPVVEAPSETSSPPA